MPRAILIVVDDPAQWPVEIAGVERITARAYLTDPGYQSLKKAEVYNLCRSYRYQSSGYYVSLLAAARGHKPHPSVTAVQDLKSQTIMRIASDDLQELIQKSLAHIQSKEFVLSIYFGQNVAKRYARLAAQLFNLFQAPLLRANFVVGGKSGKWTLANLRVIGAGDISEEHREFVVAVARDYFSGKRRRVTRKKNHRYDLAILANPEEAQPPSDEKALKRFVRAAERVGFSTEFISRDDFSRLGEFDALLIRETTSVNHHTYRFARKAVAEGLIAIDDPESILKCTNKVFLAELMERNNIPAPRTMIVHRDNRDRVAEELGLPVVLKQPDSSFSQGVVKVTEAAALKEAVNKLLDKSELIIAQEYLPTDYDWRIGIIDRQPLYACRYYMVKGHWQIIQHDSNGVRNDEGKFETLPIEHVPSAVVKTALKVANLIGNGLYGVDLKQVGKKVYVIEVNDNPNLDAGVEDQVLKEELYLRVMRVMLRRVERRKEGWPA
ncbi:RimK family protein [Desulfurivibrio dismutans]|uniref:RimK family protein n=1 Tax=Desulfurivibrio dismutans TaxID=1398908 RepID=UPI0023DAD9EE|nr:RimK family protein [Desulfurivibrio alkaliphilus]MDF1614847.1 RimK family protein [Desulfurivibrio alkaliphilus]